MADDRCVKRNKIRALSDKSREVIPPSTCLEKDHVIWYAAVLALLKENCAVDINAVGFRSKVQRRMKMMLKSGW